MAGPLVVITGVIRLGEGGGSTSEWEGSTLTGTLIGEYMNTIQHSSTTCTGTILSKFWKKNHPG